MKIFIDDAGSFSSYSPGISLFCGVTIADRTAPHLVKKFHAWRRSIIGPSNRELKGSELTEKQSNSFVHKVLPASDADTWLTVVGIDTASTDDRIVGLIRDQTATMFPHASDLMREHNNSRMQETYRQMAGWVRRRSAQNVLWIIALAETVIQSMQHSIVRFPEICDDPEFEQVGVLIDESFIRRDEHVDSWREWLRNSVVRKIRTKGLFTPREWKARNHPFRKKYYIEPGLINYGPLFMQETGFYRSHDHEGLQVADICANSLFRRHRGGIVLTSYALLRRRIVSEGGAEITLVVVNEDSLHEGDLKDHVRLSTQLGRND